MSNTGSWRHRVNRTNTVGIILAENLDTVSQLGIDNVVALDKEPRNFTIGKGGLFLSRGNAADDIVLGTLLGCLLGNQELPAFANESV